ncbi:hypothetical protein pb186bvf_013612 [Paramecium bursaria]
MFNIICINHNDNLNIDIIIMRPYFNTQELRQQLFIFNFLDIVIIIRIVYNSQIMMLSKISIFLQEQQLLKDELLQIIEAI